MDSPIQTNARDLEAELLWFTQVIDTRFKLFFQQDSEVENVFDHPVNELSGSNSPFADFVKHYQLNFAERLMLILALVPHIKPRLLDIFFTNNATINRRYTEFGGNNNGSTGSFIPTGETLVFLLAGQDLEIRFQVAALFDQDHFFSRHQIFHFPDESDKESIYNSPLQLTREYLSYFTTGEPYQHHFSAQFPAKLISTELEWEDLVLPSETRLQVKEITTWIKHGQTLMQDWEMAKKLRPGFRALFHGSPGTGKTMTACLLGKETGHDVYKVDLSMVVSKYIGETEKNLARVFQTAEHKEWILFFDEADALFGKRSTTKDAHDRYANQQVSYLLQRVESFDGIVILASNFSQNLDKAFSRRFESIIHFPMPSPQERLHIWQQGFSTQSRLASEVDLRAIAKEHELSGGAIMNVIRFASLTAIKRQTAEIDLKSIQYGIRRELMKDGKVL